MSEIRSSHFQVHSKSRVIAFTTFIFLLFLMLGAVAMGGVTYTVFMMDEMPHPVALENAVKVGAGFVGVVVLFFLFQQLRAGKDGSRFPKMMNAVPAEDFASEMEQSSDFAHRALARKARDFQHYVESAALGAGMSPSPKAYILHQEEGVNALASGKGDKAVVMMTLGALNLFDRDEIEGVAAHEVAHIDQGDTSLFVSMAMICAALMLVVQIAYYILRLQGGSSSNRRSSKGAGFVVIIALAAMVIGWLTYMGGKIIQRYGSRQAEFRADAAGAMYAGTTTGIRSALIKIQEFEQGHRVQSKIPEYMTHMCLTDGAAPVSSLQKAMSSMMATHPPLGDRIAALSRE